MNWENNQHSHLPQNVWRRVWIWMPDLFFLVCDCVCVCVTNPNTPLCSLNVVFLQVSSVEVVQAYIDRIQEVNPLLNAVIKDRQEICFLFQLWCITLKSSRANANRTGLSSLFLAPSRFDAALQEAAQVDKLIEEETGGEEVVADRLPLLGVPLSVKESYALQGKFSHLKPCTSL